VILVAAVVVTNAVHGNKSAEDPVECLPEDSFEGAPMNTSTLARHLAVGLLLSAACLAIPQAHAAGWGAALRDAPLRDFTDEDISQHLAAIRKALDSDDPKVVVEWRNDATGAGSKISVIGQPKLKGYGACKRLSTLSFSKKRKGYATPFTVCKNTDGRWVVAG
jgi:hypothetical protein